MATTGTSLPRKLNPETGEWEVQSATTTTPGVSGPSGTPDQPSPLPAPAPAWSPEPTANWSPQIGNPGGASWPGETNATPTPTTTAPTANPWDSLSGAALANDTGYITAQITKGYQERYGRAPTTEELNYWMGKATTPDTYTGGNIHQGWNPYLYDRLVNPNSAGGSSVNPGTDTIIGYNNGPPTGGSSLSSLGTLLSPMVSPTYNSPTYSAPSTAAPVSDSYDPFASMGGGVHLFNGAWVPKDSPYASAPRWVDPVAPAPIAPTPEAPTPTAPVAAVAPTTGTSPVAPQVPITTSNPTAAETAALVNRPENVDIQMLLNAGSTNPDAPSTTNPATFNPASEEVLRASPEDAAYRLGAQRSEERQRAQLAERAAANGTSQSGGFENQLAGLRQARGEGESQFLGQLAITKMQQAREDLVNGIQFALSNQQFDKAQGLQRELAQLNASIQEKQMATQVSIADKDRAMQELLANKNVSMQEKLAAIQAATTERGQSLNASTAGNALTENARQYDLGLGFNYTSLQQQANRDATIAALQGWG